MTNEPAEGAEAPENQPEPVAEAIRHFGGNVETTES